MKPLITLAHRFRGAPGWVRGIVYMVATGVVLAWMQVAIRMAAEEMHPFEVSFFRILLGVLVFVPVMVRDGLGVFRTNNLRLHVIRSAAFVGATFCFYTAVQLVPLAKVTALDFSGPLFATVLAVVMLGEKIRVRRIAALLIGFAGMLVVVRPDAGELDTGTILMLGTSVCWGISIITIKVASRTESSTTITLYSMVLGAPFALLAALPFWQTPTPEQLPILLVIGIGTTVANWCYAQAFRAADLTLVLPFDFLRLIWAAVIGFLLYSEIPTLWVWVGATMIFGSVVYIAYRESRLRAEGQGSQASPVAP
ncbi:MAG: DMT family transporter [Rhodospirillales bacterium]|nr:DMT family transporter [Rhodospirillales bacterium]